MSPSSDSSDGHSATTEASHLVWHTARRGVHCERPRTPEAAGPAPRAGQTIALVRGSPDGCPHPAAGQWPQPDAPLGRPHRVASPPVMFCQVLRTADGARGVFFLDLGTQPDQWIFNGKSIPL